MIPSICVGFWLFGLNFCKSASPKAYCYSVGGEEEYSEEVSVDFHEQIFVIVDVYSAVNVCAVVLRDCCHEPCSFHGLLLSLPGEVAKSFCGCLSVCLTIRADQKRDKVKKCVDNLHGKSFPGGLAAALRHGGLAQYVYVVLARLRLPKIGFILVYLGGGVPSVDLNVGFESIEPIFFVSPRGYLNDLCFEVFDGEVPYSVSGIAHDEAVSDLEFGC